MREVSGDLFTYNPRSTLIETTPNTVEELLTFKPTHGNILRCVTTNGVVNNKGYLVMGAGIAKHAKRRFPELPYIFGQNVDERGNHVKIVDNYGIASFPTKHHWKNNSDINLILRSCRELVCFAKNWDYVLLPRPGCNLGGLEWLEVKPLIQQILHQDKFIVVHS
jgi:hypothetical protein